MTEIAAAQMVKQDKIDTIITIKKKLVTEAHKRLSRPLKRPA